MSFSLHFEAIVKAGRSDVLTSWRRAFGIPINDPRAQTVTLEQALLDLEMLKPPEVVEAEEAEERRSGWFDEMAAQDAERAPEGFEVDGAPSAADGNTDPEAALKRLQAFTGIGRPLRDDETWESVNLDEDEDE